MEWEVIAIIGRLRLYQFLPVKEQRALPSLKIGEQAVNAMAEGYVSNPNFGKKGERFQGLLLISELKYKRFFILLDTVRGMEY